MKLTYLLTCLLTSLGLGTGVGGQNSGSLEQRAGIMSRPQIYVEQGPDLLKKSEEKSQV